MILVFYFLTFLNKRNFCTRKIFSNPKNMSVIFVNAKPGSKKTEVVKLDDNHFEIRVQEPPEKNRANNAIVKALSDHLGIPKSRIKMVGGAKGKFKVLEIE